MCLLGWWCLTFGFSAVLCNCRLRWRLLLQHPLNSSLGVVLSRELRRAVNLQKQKLIVFGTLGRIVLEMRANTPGRLVTRGKLKTWTGDVRRRRQNQGNSKRQRKKSKPASQPIAPPAFGYYLPLPDTVQATPRAAARRPLNKVGQQRQRLTSRMA